MDAWSSQQPLARRLNSWCMQPHAGVARHFGKVPFAQRCDPVQKGRILAVMLITGDPAKRNDASRVHVGDHGERQRGFGLKAELIGNPATLAQRLMVSGKPRLRYIQPSVEKGIAMPRSVDGKDAFLTVR